MKIEQSCLARRRFLGNMLGGGAAALAAGSAAPLLLYSGNFHADPPPDFIEIAKADYDFPPGNSKMVMYGPIPALLIRTPGAASKLKVFVAICTHLNCTVGYQIDKNLIFCACHEGYFNTDGQVLSGPPPEPLRQFFHKFNDGKLVIALEKENLEKTS